VRTLAGFFVGVLAALFVGAALSVTAFPVMARILQEKGLLATQMGAVGVGAAAVVTILNVEPGGWGPEKAIPATIDGVELENANGESQYPVALIARITPRTPARADARL
jgi:hypothetical protein